MIVETFCGIATVHPRLIHALTSRPSLIQPRPCTSPLSATFDSLASPTLGDISPPRGVKAAMEMQAEAERKRRAQVLESEERQANIIIADGKKTSVILQSEAAKMDQVNRALGEAEAFRARAQATAKGIAVVSKVLKEHGGLEVKFFSSFDHFKRPFVPLLPHSRL